jgi:hypothetical protein
MRQPVAIKVPLLGGPAAGRWPLAEHFHELVRDLAERVRHGRVVAAHRHIPSTRAEPSQPRGRFFAGRRELSRVRQEPWH